MGKQIFKSAATVVLLAVLATGCATQKGWVYSPKARPAARPVLPDKSVAVGPFMDARPNVNHNYLPLYLIPLMPFGWQDLGTPENVQMHITSGLWIFKPSEDLAKAIASELAAARLFREAFFTFRPSEGDLALEGRILSTKYKGYMITYGLSVFGPLLWFIGAPAAHINNDIMLELTLKDNKTGEVIWKGEYERGRGKLTWLYFMRADFEYDALFADIAKMVVADLEKGLQPGK